MAIVKGKFRPPVYDVDGVATYPDEVHLVTSADIVKTGDSDVETELGKKAAAADVIAKTAIADDLITDNPAKVLSAKQGKVLKDTIDANMSGAIVRYDVSQPLTAAQRKIARLNIGAAPITNFRDAYELRTAIRNGNVQDFLSIGDFFSVGIGNDDWLFQVAAIDYDVPVDPALTHSMRLLMYNGFDGVPYNVADAMYYAATELPAGTYWLKDSYSGKYFAFALTQAVPAGGQIAYSSYGSSGNGYTPPSVRTYATQLTTTAIETATLTVQDDEPTSGTELTTINDGNRGRFGSNNWIKSSLRQWYNSVGSGWWTPSNIYDRPQTTMTNGFLTGIDADLLDCIAPVRLRTGLSPYDNGGVYGYSDNEEFVFTPSRFEVGLGLTVAGIYETPVTAEGVAKTDPMPLFTSDKDRIKYRSGTARIWWLRAPHSSYANHAYNVYTSGALINYNALNALDAVPACTIA